MLTEYLESVGGAVTRSTRLVELEPGGSSVTATIESDGERRQVVAEWVVGCDGHRSFVREAAGIDFRGTTSRRRGPSSTRPSIAGSDDYDLVFAFLDQPAVDPDAVARTALARLRAADLRLERPGGRGRGRAPPLQAGGPVRRGREPGPVPLSLPGREPLPGGPRAARRRRGARLQPERGPRDEHRPPGRLQPRLEARPGLSRCGGPGPARHLRGRAAAGRRARRRLGRRGRSRARADRCRASGRRATRGCARRSPIPSSRITRRRPPRRSTASIRARGRSRATTARARGRAGCSRTPGRSNPPTATRGPSTSSPTGRDTRWW